MRIEIDICAANNPDAHKWLDRILAKISDGWHLWDTSAHLNPSDAFAETPWISHRGLKGEEVLELLRKSTGLDTWASETFHRHIRVTTHPRPNGEDEFGPEDAARLAETPLRLLVENRYSDGLFLRRIVDELDKPLSQLWDRPGDPIQIDSLGGIGQMPQEVRNRAENKSYRPRLIVIADSDKTSPSHQGSEKALELRERCEKYKVPCWILAKREAENYLPLVLLNAWVLENPKYTQMVDAWNRLTEDQKNFYDMKKGLPKDRDDKMSPLFREMSDADYRTLTEGFGSNVDTCWKCTGPNVKSELINRSQGDLERGIAMIRKEV